MTAEELLATMAEPLPEDDGYCTIDPETRVITIPPEYQLLGVESDEKAERIYFKCPKIVGDDIDLSKLALRVNFRNAGQVVDQYLVDDVAVDGDNITFSWLLSRRVTQYEGDVNFIVCAVRVSGETITNEWNTTLATAQVLEGLEAEVVLPEEETDIVKQLLSLAETRLNDVKKATADANTAASNANQKAQEAVNATEDARAVTEQITKDSYLHTALQSFIDTVTATPTAYGNAIVKKIEGFIRQETTTGAQLFDIEGTVTANQATKAILNDGRDLQVTGKKVDSSKWGYAYYTFPAEKVSGKTLYVYVEYNSGLGCEFNIKDAENRWTYPMVSSGTWTTISVPSNVIQCSVLFYPNRTTETEVTGVYKNIKVGFTQFETWEPYTGGQPAPNPDYPMEVQGVGYSGFFDGEFTSGLISTSTGEMASDNTAVTTNKIPCNPNDVVKVKYDGESAYIHFSYYREDGTFIQKEASSLNPAEKTVPSDCKYFRISIQGESSFPVSSVKHITVTINGMYAICVKMHGVNLCQGVESGAWLNASGNPSATADYVRTKKIKVNENTTYKESSVIDVSGIAKTVVFWDKNGSYLKYQVVSDSIQTPANCGYMAINYYKSGLVLGNVRNVMIAESSIFPESFIPYQSNITYIPISSPLFAGDQLIKRNMEHKTYRKMGFAVFDGSEDEAWQIRGKTGAKYGEIIVNNAKSSINVYCNRLLRKDIGANSDINPIGINIVSNGSIRVKYKDEDFALEELKTWLQSNPLIVEYELETPTEEPLSPEAQKSLHSIMATDEQTELTIIGVPADAGIQNQFLLPRNEDGALNTTAYCTAEKNKIVLNELVAQNLDARVNKLEIDNVSLTEQTIVVE